MKSGVLLGEYTSQPHTLPAGTWGLVGSDDVVRYNVLMEVRMKTLRVGQDIEPVTAFRSNAAKFIGRVRAHKRALVLTQNGRSAAVVLDAGEYDRLMEELELLRDIHFSNSQIAEGKSLTEVQARKALLGLSKK